MRHFLFAFAISVFSISAHQAFSAVVISEVLFNEAGSDRQGAFIEIYNNGALAVDLTNYKIGDEETFEASSNSEAMFVFPTAATINPAEIQIIAINRGVFEANYPGVIATYNLNDMSVYTVWDPDSTDPNVNYINLSNSNDQALLLGPDDSVVDAVSWGNTVAFDPGLDGNAESDGQSWERINTLIDTDSADDWQLGNPSSPGTVNVAAVPEPGSSLLLLSLAGVAAFRYRRRHKRCES